MDQEGQQGKTELITLTCRLSEKEKKGKWYLRNAATFKDIRAGENGLELFKGNMEGHPEKYDWTYKSDEGAYTLMIKNPTTAEEGTYNLVIRELDNMKTGAYVTVRAADPEYCFKKFLKEKEKGLTARPLKLICNLNVADAPLKATRWLKNGSPIQVGALVDKKNTNTNIFFWFHNDTDNILVPCGRKNSASRQGRKVESGVPSVRAGRHRDLQCGDYGICQKRREGPD